MTDIPFYSADDIQKVVSMTQAIELMRPAFAQLSSGTAVSPQRINLPLSRDNCALVMPVYLPDSAHFGVKTVCVHHTNPAQGLPRLHAIFTLFDAEQGRPLATLDAEYITALRTGAGAGLATELLAPSAADTLALFGTGKQALSQLDAISNVRNLKRVDVFASSPQKAQQFALDHCAHYAFEISAASGPEVLKEANVICTATSSSVPVFDDKWLGARVHINGIGSYHAGMAEVPAETVAASTIVVDQYQACLAEAGDIIQPLQAGLISETAIYAELGELVNGTKPPPTPECGITFFKSVGNAVQDLAVASYAYNALEKLRH